MHPLHIKKVIILVLRICGTNVEKKQFWIKSNKQKKIYETKNVVTIFRGFGLPVFPPTVFVELDRKGERDED